MSGSPRLPGSSASAANPLRKLWSKLAPSSSLRTVAPDDPGGRELDRLRRALRSSLDGHPEARSRLRHAAVLEKELKRRGLAALERLPAAFLYRASQQLAGIERGGDLLPLRHAIDRVLAARSSAGSREDSEAAASTSGEFVSQVDVAEDDGDEAWQEFQRLLSRQDDPGGSDSRQSRP